MSTVPQEVYEILDWEQAKANGLLPARPSGGPALADPDTEDQTTVDTGDDDQDEIEEAPWFCIRTDIWVCPNPSCDIYSNFVTGDHLIICWEEKDGAILGVAASAQRAGRNARIVEYEEKFGSFMSVYEWEARGMPIHGKWQDQE